jgi:hypothetical protein
VVPASSIVRTAGAWLSGLPRLLRLQTGACAQGVNCALAHSVFESWLHPSRFRTQLCCFGSSCKRRICFFGEVVGDCTLLIVPCRQLWHAVACCSTGWAPMAVCKCAAPGYCAESHCCMQQSKTRAFRAAVQHACSVHNLCLSHRMLHVLTPVYLPCTATVCTCSA